MAASPVRARPLGAALLVALVFLAARLWLATTPPLGETYYDEALTGLMGLAILHGTPQVFYWGQPYLGAIEAYVAAAGFWLAGSSTLVLRMTEAAAALVWAWAAWSIARRAAGEAWGLLAGLWIALPPVFLSFAQLSAHGQSLATALGAVSLAAAAALLDARRRGGEDTPVWVLLGVSAGLGWWSSPMMGMFPLAAAAVLAVARRRLWREPGPYVALAGFLAGSLPFWVWNRRHEWATVRHLLSWGDPPPEAWRDRVDFVAGTFL